MSLLKESINKLVEVVGDKDSEVVEHDEHYITIDGEEYLILDDDGVIEYMKDYVEDSASYFSSWFLEEVTELPKEIFEAIEGKNDAVFQLIEETCGVDKFVREALRYDGAGHFISSYDGSEIDLGNGLYAFRLS